MSDVQVKHFDLKLHYACNNNCVHCVITDQRDAALANKGKDWIPTKKVVNLLHDMRKQGFEIVTFTGGEPTLRKDLPALIALAHKMGYTIGVQTNGRVLSIPGIAQTYSGYGARFVVAVHGSSADIHDSITRADKSFDQTVKAIQNLLALGEKVSFKTVISKFNVHDMVGIARLGLDLGISRFNFTFPHALGNAGRMFKEVIPRYSVLMPSLNEAFDLLESVNGVQMATETVPLCLLGEKRRHYSIEYSVINRLHSVSRQLDEGIRDWSEDRVNEQKAKPHHCKECRYNDRCEGVWKEYLDAFGGDELIPIK